MKRKALIIIGVIAIAVAALFVLRPAHRFSDPRPVVTIGAILPLSGDMAHMGDAIRRAINFAISDINGNPDNRFAYRAIFDDNQHQARQAVSIANKMIARNRVSALVTAFSPSAFATAPLIIQHGLIGLHGTPVHEVLDGVYNFTFFPTPAEITRGLSEFAHSRNPERIALAFQISGTTLELLEGLDGKLPGEVRRFDSNLGDRDFAMLVRRMKEWNPDLIVISASPPGLNILARELHMQQVGGTKVYFNLPNVTDDFSLFEGVYTLSYSQGNTEFVERMRSASTFFAAYFYDSVRVFAAAVERAASDSDDIPSAEDISAQMRRMRAYYGVAGHYDITDAGAFQSAMLMYRIENGKVVGGSGGGKQDKASTPYH